MLVVAWRILETKGRWRLRYALLEAGLFALALSQSPPLGRAAYDTFPAHMLEHLLMMLVAAPLIAGARPELLLMRELPQPNRERLARTVERFDSRVRAPALLAGVAMFLALWVWHVPWLFDEALVWEPVHMLQHACFMLASLFFWRYIFLLPPHGTQFFLPRAALVFVTMVHSGALGALLLFSQSIWYTAYVATPSQLLHDQQASGLLMWLAGLPLYFATLGWLVLVWLWRDERENAKQAPQLRRPPISSKPTP
jgi:cytochrome c oxidase assembly factor CtaG